MSNLHLSQRKEHRCVLMVGGNASVYHLFRTLSSLRPLDAKTSPSRSSRKTPSMQLVKALGIECLAHEAP
jgi:hypothetical protein